MKSVYVLIEHVGCFGDTCQNIICVSENKNKLDAMKKHLESNSEDRYEHAGFEIIEDVQMV